MRIPSAARDRQPASHGATRLLKGGRRHGTGPNGWFGRGWLRSGAPTVDADKMTEVQDSAHWTHGQQRPRAEASVPCHRRERSSAMKFVVPLAVMAVVATGIAAVSAGASNSSTLASDAFHRTVAGGWGKADVGGAWSLGAAPASMFSVAGGAGRMVLLSNGQGPRASLQDVNSTQASVRATLSTDKLPTGSGVYLSVIGRRVGGAGQYQVTVRIQRSGVVTMYLLRRSASGSDHVISAQVRAPGLVYSPTGGALAVRLDVMGTSPTTVQAKVWRAGTREPSLWAVKATDTTPSLQAAGSVGVSAYLSRGATNAPIIFKVSHFATVGTSVTNLTHKPSTSTAKPTPTTSASAPASPPPPAATGRATASAGSVVVGSARYGVPVGAVFVSGSGSDAASGSVSAPVASVARAVALVGSGGTVVLRGGVYHQSVVLPAGKAVTVQAYPGEAVWFDGSRVVSGFVRAGSVWRADGWTASFDHSPTYTKGAPDNTAADWSFVNPSYPMAAYPDQVWVDGVAQRQVGSVAAVVPGSFFVDTVAHRLYLGSDPVGRVVRASDLATAFTVSGAGSVLRGFGVRDYATSMPLMGTVRVTAPSVTLENLVVADNATQGINVGATGVTLRHVSALSNGLLGVNASFADGLRLVGVRASGNNTEHFNMSPVSGGVKIGRTRGVSISGSVFASNRGPGLWLDASVYDSVITGNDMVGNAGHGISVEISAKSVIANNLVADNGGTGMKINDSSSVQIWNNTIIDNTGQPIWLVQDSRVASNLSIFGHDPRRPMPDPTMTWLLGPVTVMNNVIARTSANCLLCVQDNALHRSAATIGVTADGNIYNRPTPTNPTWLVQWPPPGRGVSALFGFFLPDPNYSNLAALQASTGQEAHGLSVDGRSVVAANGALVGLPPEIVRSIARPLTPALRQLLGGAVPPGVVGAVRQVTTTEPVG